MARAWSIILTVLLASSALAGCAMPGGDDDAPPTPVTNLTDPSFPPTTTPAVTPTPDAPNATLDNATYTLAVAGVPTQAKPGAAVNFTLFVNGSLDAASQHIGAHYANNSTTSPPASGRQDCAHVTGALPGTFTVNCTFAQIGTWHVWGHAQVNESGELLNWWAEPFVVKVRDYALNLTNVPTNSQSSGSNFTVQVNVSAVGASENVTSDHIGVHWWNATEANPSLANAAGACVHVAGGVVDTHSIVCNITNGPGLPKEFFLRGHVRVTEGATEISWWSAEQKVTVLGALPSIG